MIQSVPKWSVPVLLFFFAAQAWAAAEEVDLEQAPAAAQPITTAELHQRLMDKNREASPLLLVDARGEELFRQGHLPGAINVPAGRVDELGPALPKEAQIVVYCGGPGCPHSFVVARWLVERGWPHVFHYMEGISAWSSSGGYPVEGTALSTGSGGS